LVKLPGKKRICRLLGKVFADPNSLFLPMFRVFWPKKVF
jgi:hypothetical protein